MIKVLWGLIGLNTLALLVFIAAYFILNSGKQVDYQEKGWTFILAAAGLLIILLAALPLKFGSSTGAIIFAGFFFNAAACCNNLYRSFKPLAFL